MCGSYGLIRLEISLASSLLSVFRIVRVRYSSGVKGCGVFGMHTISPRFWVSVIIPLEYLVFMMLSKSCFVTSHVILKNSRLIPSHPGAFLAFPVATAVRNSSNVVGSSRMFAAIGGSFLRTQSSVCRILSAELGM